MLCIGILAETCSDTFGEEATGIITQILELASRAKAAMLRATSMWTLGKLMDLLVVDVHSINIGYELCLNNIE